LKKLLLLMIILLAVSDSSYGIEGEASVPSVSPISLEDLNNSNFFQSPASRVIPEVRNINYNYGFDAAGREYKEPKSGKSPFVKQMRLKLTGKYYDLTSEENKSTKEDSTSLKNKILNKITFKKNKNKTEILPDSNQAVLNSIQEETSADIPESENLSFTSGISEHVGEKELILDSDKVSYDEDTGDMVATGRPKLVLPPQNITIIADKMTYNQDSNILKGIGNVIVIKDGAPTRSDYIEVNMNEEEMYMNNISSSTDALIMDAEKAVQQDSLLILTNGNFHSEQSEIHRISSRMVGPRFSNMIINDDEQALFFGNPEKSNLHFDIDKLYIEARNNHNKYTAKGIKVSKNGKYWFAWPSLTAYTNKERDYFEANYPEFGTRRKLGMFVGPGFTFGGPGSSIVKIIPMLNYQHSSFGFGGMLKFKNTFNNTELGYGSAADIFFLKGIQRLDDHLYLQYSANSYMDEWFLGARMPKYMAELYYDRAYVLPDFLSKNRDLQFRHRLGAGLMEDADKNYYGEKINGTGMSTTRFRYMAQISQNLYSYKNPEKDFYFDFSLALQGSAAVYGTGDTQFIARFGPRAHIQYKRWMQELGYYQTGYDDRSPMPRYDMYRYGHSSVYVSEIVRVCKYLSVGWSGMITLSDDSPNGKMFQENRFIFAIGPDDLKIRLGYDFIRQTTFFGFDVAFDTKGTNISYKRMEIKNPEKLGANNEDEHKLAFTSAKKNQETESKVSNKTQGASKSNVLKYAQVIDIEDPDKETVD
jgi:hypothetical protein